MTKLLLIIGIFFAILMPITPLLTNKITFEITLVLRLHSRLENKKLLASENPLCKGVKRENIIVLSGDVKTDKEQYKPP